MDSKEFVDFNKGISSPKELVLFTMKLMATNLFKGSVEPTFQQGQGQITKGADYRETFMNAVDFIVSLLQPDYDQEMIDNQKAFEEGDIALKTELEMKVIRSRAWEIANSRFNDGSYVYKDQKNVYLWYKHFFTKEQNVLIEKTSANFEEYMTKRYEYYLMLFRDINFCLKRIKWLTTNDYSEYQE
jgi:hypothetical protein